MSIEESSKPVQMSWFIRFLHSIRKGVIAGLLVVVPLWLTYFALRFFFTTFDGFFGPLITRLIGFSIPGLGLVLLFVFLYLIGMITSNILGRSLVHFWESILNRIPFVRNIYQGAKQLIHMISASKTLGFKQVVFIEYPRQGLLAIGFLTNFIEEKQTGKRYAIVFLPSPPNPINGMFIFVPAAEIIETNVTIEEGIKMVVSAGIVASPNVLMRRAKGTIP